MPGGLSTIIFLIAIIWGIVSAIVASSQKKKQQQQRAQKVAEQRQSQAMRGRGETPTAATARRSPPQSREAQLEALRARREQQLAELRQKRQPVQKQTQRQARVAPSQSPAPTLSGPGGRRALPPMRQPPPAIRRPELSPAPPTRRQQAAVAPPQRRREQHLVELEKERPIDVISQARLERAHATSDVPPQRHARRLLIGGARSLRRAIILKELLDPPVALRQGDDHLLG